MTRPRPTHTVDWRPLTLLSALYTTFLVTALWFDVLPAMRAVLEAT